MWQYRTKTARPKSREKAKQKEEEKKALRADLYSLPLFLLLLAGYFVLSAYQQDKYPKLFSFGIQKWFVLCEGNGRIYRMKSNNPVNSNSDRVITGRDLSFLDESGKTLYYTKRFDKTSLDSDGVWRFFYVERDVRLFGEKNREAVLQGDESKFEIAEDFSSLVIVSKDGGEITLSCRRTEPPKDER